LARPIVDWKAADEASERYQKACENKTFSTDWFSFHIPVWSGLLNRYRDRSVKILEIGSFEGRSTVFFLEHCPLSHVTAVDSFFLKAGMDNWSGDIRVEDCETVFDRNMEPYAGRVTKITAQSARALNELWMSGQKFDIIYVDGSHDAEDCLSDSILAWRLLKPRGLMIWDDYLWELQSYGKSTPAWGLNAFLRVFSKEIDVRHARYQVAARKRA
jgi:hypothetical protein